MLRPQNTHLAAKSLLFLAAFLLLAIAITSQTSKRLRDFDQSFYTTIAYDIERHGVFSSGIFDGTDSTRDMPAPGMFFVPGYPLLVLAAMKVDPRFGEAVRCSVEGNHGLRDETTCEDYALPIHLAHAFLLAIAVLAFATAAELIFGSARVFWLAGALATASFATYANLFSFIMTESMTVALYALVMLFALLAWQTQRLRYFVVTGLLLGLLCLTRPSFVVLCPVLLAISLLNGMWLAPRPARQAFRSDARFPGDVPRGRRTVDGSQSAFGRKIGTDRGIRRRRADRTARIQPHDAGRIHWPVRLLRAGRSATSPSTRRVSPVRCTAFFIYAPDSIFHAGRGHRDALLEQYTRLDPIISQVVIDDMRTNWWRHLLVSIPLGWCGMWVGGLWALVTVPLFALACVRTARKRRPYLLLYATPALVMLGLHALLANESTRYNLALIGPYCAAAAWLMTLDG